MRLSVQVQPLPTPSAAWGPGKVDRFLLISPPTKTIQQLWTDIEDKYKSGYIESGQHLNFAIKTLQDGDGNDLDRSYSLADIFTGVSEPCTIKVIQTRIDRECSIPVNSTLRAIGAPAPLFRPRIIPPIPLFHEAEARSKASQDARLAQPDPDRPLPSCERNLEDEEQKEEDADSEDEDDEEGNVNFRPRNVSSARRDSESRREDEDVHKKPARAASTSSSHLPRHLRNPYSVNREAPRSNRQRIRPDIYEVPESDYESMKVKAPHSLSVSYGHTTHNAHRRVSDATQNGSEPLITPDSTRMDGQTPHAVPQSSRGTRQKVNKMTNDHLSSPGYVNGRRSSPLTMQGNGDSSKANGFTVDAQEAGKRSENYEDGEEEPLQALHDKGNDERQSKRPREPSEELLDEADYSKATSGPLRTPFNSFSAKKRDAPVAKANDPQPKASASSRQSLSETNEATNAHERLQRQIRQKPRSPVSDADTDVHVTIHAQSQRDRPDVEKSNGTPQMPAWLKDSITPPKGFPANHKVAETPPKRKPGTFTKQGTAAQLPQKRNGVSQSPSQAHLKSRISRAEHPAEDQEAVRQAVVDLHAVRQRHESRVDTSKVDGTTSNFGQASVFRAAQDPLASQQVQVLSAAKAVSGPRMSAEEVFGFTDVMPTPAKRNKKTSPPENLSSAWKQQRGTTQPPDNDRTDPSNPPRAKSLAPMASTATRASYTGWLREEASSSTAPKRKLDTEPAEDTASKKQARLDFKGKAKSKAKTGYQHVIDEDPIVVSDDSEPQFIGHTPRPVSRGKSGEPVVVVHTSSSTPKVATSTTRKPSMPRNHKCKNCKDSGTHQACRGTERNPYGPCMKCINARINCVFPDGTLKVGPSSRPSNMSQASLSARGTSGSVNAAAPLPLTQQPSSQRPSTQLASTQQSSMKPPPSTQPTNPALARVASSMQSQQTSQKSTPRQREQPSNAQSSRMVDQVDSEDPGDISQFNADDLIGAWNTAIPQSQPMPTSSALTNFSVQSLRASEPPISIASSGISAADVAAEAKARVDAAVLATAAARAPSVAKKGRLSLPTSSKKPGLTMLSNATNSSPAVGSSQTNNRQVEKTSTSAGVSGNGGVSTTSPTRIREPTAGELLALSHSPQKSKKAVGTPSTAPRTTDATSTQPKSAQSAATAESASASDSSSRRTASSAPSFPIEATPSRAKQSPQHLKANTPPPANKGIISSPRSGVDVFHSPSQEPVTATATKSPRKRAASTEQVQDETAATSPKKAKRKSGLSSFRAVDSEKSSSKKVYPSSQPAFSKAFPIEKGSASSPITKSKSAKHPRSASDSDSDSDASEQGGDFLNPEQEKRLEEADPSKRATMRKRFIGLNRIMFERNKKIGSLQGSQSTSQGSSQPYAPEYDEKMRRQILMEESD